MSARCIDVPFQEWIKGKYVVESRGFTSDCWVWTGELTYNGYASQKVVRAFQINGCRRQRIHRLAYHFFVGPIEDGKVIDHLCRVRNCINPIHLEQVTPLENARRALLNKGWMPPEQRTHCSRGHELPEIGEQKKRSCRVCRNEYMKEWGRLHPGYRQRYPDRKVA